MRKTILILTAVACLIVFASCAGTPVKPAESAQPAESQNGTLSEDGGESATCEVGGQQIRLDRPATHRNMRFLESSDFEIAGYEQAIHLNCASEGGDRLFVIHIVYFVGTPIEEAMGDADYVYTDKTIAGVAYKYFEDTINGVPNHTYVCNQFGDTYAISFESTQDTGDLETVFMKNVSFSRTEE